MNASLLLSYLISLPISSLSPLFSFPLGLFLRLSLFSVSVSVCLSLLASLFASLSLSLSRPLSQAAISLAFLSHTKVQFREVNESQRRRMFSQKRFHLLHLSLVPEQSRVIVVVKKLQHRDRKLSDSHVERDFVEPVPGKDSLKRVGVSPLLSLSPSSYSLVYSLSLWPFLSL